MSDEELLAAALDDAQHPALFRRSPFARTRR